MNVLITGASSGIGRALAQLLAKPGNTVVLTARRADKLHSVADQVRSNGGIAHVIPADLELEADIIRLANETEQVLPMMDVVVHNAGRGHVSSVQDTSTELWQRMIALNATAPFILTRSLLHRMRLQNTGHLVYISSMAGKIGYPYNAAYVAAKHALIGFVAALRGELIDTTLNATVLCPSGVSTDWGSVTEGMIINDFYAKAIPRSREIARDQRLSLAPLKKMMPPSKVAEIILNAVNNGRNNDIYTHDGTDQLALQAQTNRIEQEEEHKALWLAMREVYNQA